VSKLKENQPKNLSPTSIRLPAYLYQQLEQKSEEMGNLGISKTIQILLESALENQQTNNQFKYTIMTYALMQEAIASLVEDAQSLMGRADARAEQMIERLQEVIT
jgi:metal-responsive CopG/Arc/MetJ family transcriptional regulator